ncbi:hypothetical protein C8J56DRAFT_1163723 [Mycena floridula]|nr:hypothetical protein C8J56DRAFT_1163723 [Mycena floridula]
MSINSLDLEALLASNEPLSEQETSLIQKRLRIEVDKRTGARDAKITGTAKAMGLPRAELVAFLDRIKNHPDAALQLPLAFQDRCMKLNMDLTFPSEMDCMTLLFPFRRFPARILQRIFKEYCGGVEAQPSKAPLLLCSICQKWRSLAMSDPKLWTRLDLTVTSWYHVDFCKFFLLNSGDMPLELSFQFPASFPTHPEFSSSNQLAKQIINLCLLHLPRWKSFSYAGHPNFPDIKIEPSVTAPLLQELCFARVDGPASQFVATDWANSIIRTGSRSSKTLQWSWVWTSSISSIPLNHLTSFSMGRLLGVQEKPSFKLTFPQFILLLHLYPSLKICDINLELGAEADALSNTFVHQQLRSFSLYVCAIDLPLRAVQTAVKNVFASMSLPALQEFSIEISGTTAFLWPQGSFIGMLERSQCSLRKLDIHGVELPSYFDICFTHWAIKDLERLGLLRSRRDERTGNHPVPSSIIAALDWDSNSQLLPNILELELRVQDNQLEAFEKMVISRKRAGHVPSIVVLGSSRSWGVVGRLREGGVDIQNKGKELDDEAYSNP